MAEVRITLEYQGRRIEVERDLGPRVPLGKEAVLDAMNQLAHEVRTTVRGWNTP